MTAQAPLLKLLGPAAELEVAVESRPSPRQESIAIVHDWCPAFRGGERVLAALCRLAPRTDVFTIFDFLDGQTKAEAFPTAVFHTSPANRLPAVARYYRALFFLCPFLIEQFDVTDYDLVISSSAAFARGVITRPDQPHICYVHSPMRYAWDEQFSYLRQSRLGRSPLGLIYRALLYHLRTWDVRTAHGPDLMLTNSTYVKARIKRIYGRPAAVVPPPVAVESIPFSEIKDDYYVTACFLAPYKRTDLVVEAFNAMPSRRLVVIGAGQQEKRLRALAGPNVTFRGYLPRDDFLAVLRDARALVFAGCEDFGITLAEAQACGTPVIAFGRGGASDIVRPLGGHDEPTGVLFPSQSADGLRAAVERFEADGHQIAAAHCRANAARFSEAAFNRSLHNAIDRAILQKQRELASGSGWPPEAE
jgi:glycosyltransferase involved in cell wall biosynthesis